MPPRLLLIATGIDRRGAESHVLALGRGLAARGWPVGVAYWGGSGELATEFREAGVVVWKLPFHGELNPLSLPPFVHLIREFRPHVVHTHLPLAEFYGNLAAALCRVPAIVSTKHSDHAIFQRPLVRLGHALMSAPNSAVISVSDHIARFVRSVGLWPRTPLVTIRNGLDIAQFDLARDPFKAGALVADLMPEGGRLIGAAGRLEPEKGFDLLISSMPHILAHVPTARLAIAGEGSRRPELEGLIARLGLGGRVTLLGARPDLAALMHAFDVFVLSSRAEPFGLVLLEAMAAQKPVVATNVGGVPEVVVPGQTGDLVRTEDPVALGDAVAALFGDGDRSQRYGAAGRRRVEQVFTMKRMVDATERLYRGALQHRPLGSALGAPC